jgi:hypothetical protein
MDSFPLHMTYNKCSMYIHHYYLFLSLSLCFFEAGSHYAMAQAGLKF